MRVMVFFDLPVKTKSERATATRFRKELIQEGYYMVQFSVYARICSGVESAHTHIERLKNFAPESGSIRCMLVTEKQYSSIIVFAGKKKKEEKPAKFIQLSFL